MSKREDTLNKAYGNMPREIGFWFDTDWIKTPRGVRYYWIKIKRYFTR
jgi:hypothetical protein